jgi:hypothetical protein
MLGFGVKKGVMYVYMWELQIDLKARCVAT